MQTFLQVRTGGMSESGYGNQTPELFLQEQLGNYSVLFVGPWRPDALRTFAEFCRNNGMTFVMDEMVNRLTGELTTNYHPFKEEIRTILDEYSDVCDGSLLMCEYGGLMFYWPHSTVAGSKTLPPPARNFEEAAFHTEKQMKESIAYARDNGIKEPYRCIEACGVCASYLYRAGIDRVDMEVIYTNELERGYSAVKGASLAFGKKHFGVDMAMVWYGGNQHDDLWFQRWRTSLYHAFLRGADPIYAEHGVMDYKALGKKYDTGHEQVRRFRSALSELAAFAKENPRPEGFPEAAIAVMHGRFDGFAGAGQTHLWGQRENDAFRIGAPDLSWNLFERFYHRRTWENRERFGDVDFSGNPPLGQVDIIPFDVPDSILMKYKAILFLGRNCMDSGLYEKLLRYVRNGGQLLMTGAHLNTSLGPDDSFEPFRGGDWSDLFGVRIRGIRGGAPFYGLKYKAEPSCGWRFPLWSPNCDPKFTDGGFRLFDTEVVDAEVLAVASDRFADYTWDHLSTGVLYSKTHGKGCAIFVNTPDHPGENGLCAFYGALLDSCAEANQCYPKVECSDRIRYASYRTESGRVIYFLNTEEHLELPVIVYRSEKERETFLLKPGLPLKYEI